MRSEVLSTKIADVYVENGLLYIKYTVVELKLEDFKFFVAEIRAHFSTLLPLPIVSDMNNARSASKEVRDYAASDEVGEVVSSSAIVVTSSIVKIAVNLFLQFSRPKYPAKLFTDRDKAIEWVSQFKK